MKTGSQGQSGTIVKEAKNFSKNYIKNIIKIYINFQILPGSEKKQSKFKLIKKVIGMTKELLNCR